MKLNNDTNLDLDGTNLEIAIILPYFNDKIGLELLKNAKKELIANKVREENIRIIRVAGALEIPFACKKIIKQSSLDGIIALGIVIRGETSHFELVTQTTYNGLMQVQLETETPISFGIIACENIEQAKKRASKDGLDKGKEATQALLIQLNL